VDALPSLGLQEKSAEEAAMDVMTRKWRIFICCVEGHSS
jgi:hypothetical protein